MRDHDVQHATSRKVVQKTANRIPDGIGPLGTFSFGFMMAGLSCLLSFLNDFQDMRYAFLKLLPYSARRLCMDWHWRRITLPLVENKPAPSWHRVAVKCNKIIVIADVTTKLLLAVITMTEQSTINQCWKR
jgi:hypothetical protein